VYGSVSGGIGYFKVQLRSIWNALLVSMGIGRHVADRFCTGRRQQGHIFLYGDKIFRDRHEHAHVLALAHALHQWKVQG
jgi:hypothetical protein